MTILTERATRVGNISVAHGFTSSRPVCGDPLILGPYEAGEHESWTVRWKRLLTLLKERWGGDQGLGTAFKVFRDQLLPTSFLSFIPPALKTASHLESIQPMNLWLTSHNQTIAQSLTIWSRIAIARMGCSEEERWRWTNRKQSRSLGLHREEGAKIESLKTLCVHSVKWTQEYRLYSGRVLLMLSPFIHCLKVGKR